MRFDPEKLNALCALPDGELWYEIQKIASSHGISLPKACPNAKTMQDIRNAASGGAKIKLGEAIKVINEYKKGAK